jgi:hypothetical protein
MSTGGFVFPYNLQIRQRKQVEEDEIRLGPVEQTAKGAIG